MRKRLAGTSNAGARVPAVDSGSSLKSPKLAAICLPRAWHARDPRRPPNPLAFAGHRRYVLVIGVINAEVWTKCFVFFVKTSGIINVDY